MSSQHWLGKTCAGIVFGYGLAIALSGLFAWLTPGGISGGNGKLQVIMWLVAPIWAGVLCGVYFFRDSLRAWLWLGGATALAFTALAVVRHLMG